MQPTEEGGPLRRAYAIGAASIVLLLVTVGLGLYLGAETRTQFREIEQSWRAYAGGTDRKGAWISALRGHLGYGGIIHHFKNYVLRHDPVYLREARAQLRQFDTVMNGYLAQPLDARERALLETIRATVDDYRAKLPIAIRAAREGWPPERTDPLVRVDDTDAIRALADLERLWQATRSISTTRVGRAVAEGQALIEIGFLALGGLALAALTIGAMLVLLLRDMRRALVRLGEELVERTRLERSESRLAEAVEQSPATIFITDTRARILYANTRFEEITGWRRDEVEGHTPRFLQSGETPPEVYAEIRARLDRGESWHGVFRNRRKDGASYWAETTILPLIGADGQIENYLGIAEDITEKRKAREQIVRAQKLEAVGLLAGGVAHDFNNLLTTIVGSAHLAALDTEEGSDLRTEIDQIDIAARRAQSLVRELLTFARRQPGRPRPTDLDAILAEVERLMRASVPPTVAILRAGQRAPVGVMCDPTHLHQILMNLCRNAAEAIGGGEGTITLGVHAATASECDGLADRAAGWITLEVADDGPGMTEATRKRLFDPFFTTKPLGKGSGLGLAVVSGLVEEMGGRISVDSAPAAGARFTLVLPGAVLGAAAPQTAQPELPTGRERLVLVDDESEVAGTFRRVLARLGYQVEAFTSPVVALERLRRAPERVDLMLTDMVMPEMSGEELARAVRRLRPDLPVILCTAYRSSRPDLPGPAVEVIDKPVDPGHLARRVRAALDEAAAAGIVQTSDG